MLLLLLLLGLSAKGWHCLIKNDLIKNKNKILVLNTNTYRPTCVFTCIHTSRKFRVVIGCKVFWFVESAHKINPI